MNRRPYWTCEYCHSNLDYGERCDCRTNLTIERWFLDNKNNQFVVGLTNGDTVNISYRDYHDDYNNIGNPNFTVSEMLYLIVNARSVAVG